MARSGDVIENPVTGERIVFRKTSKGTNGELLQLDLFVKPHGFVAAEHIHPRLEERFEAISGTLHYRVAGNEQDLGPGQAMVVPPRTRHVWWNASNDEIHILLEFRPGLNMEAFFETFFGLARDGKTNKRGLPSPLQLAVIGRHYRDEIGPALFSHKVLGVLSVILSPIGRLLGYRASYPKYSTSS